MTRLDAAYFQRIYADGPDPWGFETRWYETRKYALTVAALPRARYRRAFEPGCAIGVLTAKLAERCDELVASELMPEIAERARARVVGLAGVQVRVGAIPDSWPEGEFDLVVLSEVAYYLDERGFDLLLDRVGQSLTSDGHVVAVHWTGSTDYPRSGDLVHEVLAAGPLLQSIAEYTEREFRLSVLERRRPDPG